MEHLIAQYGYVGLYCLLMLGIVGLPVPDETLLAISGHFIQAGRLGLTPTFIAAFSGSATGITISYILGRTGGLALVHRYGPRWGVTPERLQRAHNFFERAGRWSLFFGYFVPGVRHFVAVVAGASELRAPVFAVFAYAGALFWVSTFLGLGYFLSEQWLKVADRVHHGLAAVALLLAAVALLVYLLRRHGHIKL